MQTDPIFYADNMNMYAYVGNDPVNVVDPTGKNCKALDNGIGSVCTYTEGGHVSKKTNKPEFISAAAPNPRLIVLVVAGAIKKFNTSRAARREAMRQEKIPTSQQPASQSNNASGREQTYEVPKEGGGTELKSVQQQTMDRSHPESPHWEAGKIKTDPLTGEPRMNDYGRPKLVNDKSKVEYEPNVELSE